MKNLRILKTAVIGSTTHAEGDLVPNVDNGIAARLIMDGLAVIAAAETARMVIPALPIVPVAGDAAKPAKPRKPGPGTVVRSGMKIS